jgi:hypothetical protein
MAVGSAHPLHGRNRQMNSSGEIGCTFVARISQHIEMTAFADNVVRLRDATLPSPHGKEFVAVA